MAAHWQASFARGCACSASSTFVFLQFQEYICNTIHIWEKRKSAPTCGVLVGDLLSGSFGDSFRGLFGGLFEGGGLVDPGIGANVGTCTGVGDGTGIGADVSAGDVVSGVGAGVVIVSNA